LTETLECKDQLILVFL